GTREERERFSAIALGAPPAFVGERARDAVPAMRGIDGHEPQRGPVLLEHGITRAPWRYVTDAADDRPFHLRHEELAFVGNLRHGRAAVQHGLPIGIFMLVFRE